MKVNQELVYFFSFGFVKSKQGLSNGKIKSGLSSGYCGKVGWAENKPGTLTFRSHFICASIEPPHGGIVQCK